jgi:UDP-N-acetylmuramoyl-tripeptide--D-alanyl-D-alanine ligase
MLWLTAADVAAAAGGAVALGDPAQVIGDVSIDTRTLQPGDLFVAIRGERFDGHQYLVEAFTKGATGFLVDRQGRALAPAALAPGLVLIVVEDTVRALQSMARDVRRRSGTRVVAITGSAGKTTTKEITAEFLAARFRVVRNRGNLNNHIGLPLSLLELRGQPDVAVVELGMNHPGEIRTLVGIAEPEVRVWTNVGDAHVGFFASADAIADAKAEILEAPTPESVVVANADDPRVMARVNGFGGRVITFGTHAEADVTATDIESRGLEGMAARVRTPAGEARVETALLGLGNLSNVLAATAVAHHFGVGLDACVSRAARLRPASHRGELLRLPGGITLIDDSYNSSPAALRRSLETVATATGSARKTAVLGEMLELGAHAEGLHRECGEAAARAGLDLLVAVGGPAAAALAEAAVSAGMDRAAVAHVATSEEATRVCLERMRPGDLVLVKGSRSIRTDVVVERLKAEFA